MALQAIMANMAIQCHWRAANHPAQRTLTRQIRRHFSTPPLPPPPPAALPGPPSQTFCLAIVETGAPTSANNPQGFARAPGRLQLRPEATLGARSPPPPPLKLERCSGFLSRREKESGRMCRRLLPVGSSLVRVRNLPPAARVEQPASTAVRPSMATTMAATCGRAAVTGELNACGDT